jgi:RIO-like serine/threonine protein kinase
MNSQKSMPDTKAISCNMRNFQLARIICESEEDNILAKLRKEGEKVPSVLDGDVVVVVSSFTNDRKLVHGHKPAHEVGQLC